ncbi:MAG: exonuclease [Gammaproteobacteria bacterium]|nr:exonuclease [Gammaproteobacteria bacterium]
MDFETACQARDSACAVGLATCENGRVVAQNHYLIRPPSRLFTFTAIHGLGWRDVAAARDFGALWPTLAAHFADVEFLVAHNAPFDRGVLAACQSRYGITAPVPRFECTVRLARQVLGCRPANLPAVCARLDIPLRHHDAGSDATAAARIALAALDAGWCPGAEAAASNTRTRRRRARGGAGGQRPCT